MLQGRLKMELINRQQYVMTQILRDNPCIYVRWNIQLNSMNKNIWQHHHSERSLLARFSRDRLLISSVPATEDGSSSIIWSSSLLWSWLARCAPEVELAKVTKEA